MANNIDVKVRAPGANTPEDFVINLDLTAQEGIQIFIQQKWRGLIQNQQNARLVLSPLNKRNGSIIAPATTFRSIAFNPKKVRFFFTFVVLSLITTVKTTKQ